MCITCNTHSQHTDFVSFQENVHREISSTNVLKKLLLQSTCPVQCMAKYDHVCVYTLKYKDIKLSITVVFE